MMTIHCVIRKWGALICFRIHATGSTINYNMIVANEFGRHFFIRNNTLLCRPTYKQSFQAQ